jgi:hypothetical protein
LTIRPSGSSELPAGDQNFAEKVEAISVDDYKEKAQFVS